MTSYQKLIGRHRMRCSVCRTRFTLKKNPDEHKRWPRCPACKTWKTYSCEAARRREMERQSTCRCAAYPFPHRAGSLVGCTQHPDRAAGLPMSAQEEREWEATCRTPRGACTLPERHDSINLGLDIAGSTVGGDEPPF